MLRQGRLFSSHVYKKRRERSLHFELLNLKMEKSKRSKPHVGVDRLSDLPDSVIFHILWFVPMNYVVRTTILSKRWRNLWTTTPFLNFDSSYVFEEDDRDRFRTSVSRALLRWNGVRILKFRVNSCGEQLHKRIFRESELYASFAKDKGVEEFYLHLPFIDLNYFDNGNDVYSVPQCLYSCSSLKLLSLRFCNFEIYGNVRWNQLKSLTVTKGFGLTEHVMNRILCGSPKLEVLRLSVVDEGHNLNIRSDSLKELWICKYLLHIECASLVSELIIWTPNLEALSIKGIPYGNCRLIDVKSSAHVTLGFYGPDYHESHECKFEFYPKSSILSRDYIADKFHKVLETIKHFERVTLFYCCLKVLGAMKVRCIGSTFPNVESLEIGRHYDNCGELIGFFDIFPQLKRLVLRDDRTLHFLSDRDELECKVYFPKCLLPQLRTVEVTWSHGDSIFSSMEILLKYATNLEKMVFRVDSNRGANSLSLASNKLLKMPRSSGNCTIDILQE